MSLARGMSALGVCSQRLSIGLCIAICTEACECVYHTGPTSSWKCSVRWVSVWMLDTQRIWPLSCVSSWEFCMEPSGSPALAFQDSMSTIVTKRIPMAYACLRAGQGPEVLELMHVKTQA